MPTVVRRHMVQATIVTTDQQVLRSISADLSSTKSKKGFDVTLEDQVYHWVWKPLKHIDSLQDYSSWLAGGTVKRPASFKQPSIDDNFVMLPWTEAEVQSLLMENGASAEQFEMSLEELAKKAMRGQLHFAQREADGNLCCYKNVVLLRIISPQGQCLLVQTNCMQ